MIKATDMIRLFRQAREERWGYIWGRAGQVWTQASQNAATREQTVKYGQKWVGKKVADCSGLFVWAYKQLGAKIYHGSNTIWNKYCSAQGKITPGMEMKPGTAVFLVKNNSRHHIGLYVGDGVVIEARQTSTGVVESAPGDWDEWGELKDVEYDAGGVDVVTIPKKTIRQGSKGNAVRDLQRILRELGYVLEADGIFGKITAECVKTFQGEHGLNRDGIVGPLTWAALEDPALPKKEIKYRAVVEDLNESEADGIVAEWTDRARKEVML